MYRIFSAPAVIKKPTIARDIIIEHLTSLREGVKDKSKIDELILKANNLTGDITVSDVKELYKDYMALCEESIHNPDLRFNGYQLPVEPIKDTLRERIRNLLTQE